MFISKKHKLAYFAIPRIASNSVQQVLENSGLDDSENIVFNLTNPIDGDKIQDGNSEEVIALNKYHMNPTRAIENGFITLEELRSYTTFGFVRDPLQRWVSRFLLAKTYGLWQGDSLDNMILAIRHGLFEGNRQYPIDFKWDLKSYFYHNDELVVRPYKLEDMETVMTSIITAKGGVVPEIPQIQLGDTPDEFKRPIEEWLPADCVIALRTYYADDIEFYNSL